MKSERLGMKIKFWLAPLVALALLGAACSSDSSVQTPTTTTSTSATTTPAPETSTSAPAATTTEPPATTTTAAEAVEVAPATTSTTTTTTTIPVEPPDEDAEIGSSDSGVQIGDIDSEDSELSDDASAMNGDADEMVEPEGATSDMSEEDGDSGTGAPADGDASSDSVSNGGSGQDGGSDADGDAGAGEDDDADADGDHADQDVDGDADHDGDDGDADGDHDGEDGDADGDGDGDADEDTDADGDGDDGDADDGDGDADGDTDSDQDGETASACEDQTNEASPEPAEGDLPRDPAVRIGQLENGLTYYLRCNDSPGGSLTVRLAVNAGSLHEEEAGSGIAHYLEHMLFNGTEKYPRNELTNVLQGLGIEFGADVNAYTSFDETVYELQARVQNEVEVNTVFDVLSQWAHAATIDPADVEEERGIVRDEYRLRIETASGKVAIAFPRLYNAGTPYEGRLAIGTVESIESLTAQDLRDYYEKWYVPSNMAVVAVGDMSLERLEGLVNEHFGAIPAGEKPEQPDNSSEIDQEDRYDIATSPGQGYTYLSLDIRLPSHARDTIEGDKQWWIEQVIAIMLDNRLQDGYEQGLLSQTDPTHWQSFVHTHGLRYYGTNLRAEDYEEALDDFWSLMLALKESGFEDEDLARAITAINTSLDQRVEAEGTTQDSSYAVNYVQHFLRGTDISTPTQRRARVQALLADLTPDQLSERFREIMDASGLLLIGVGADPSDLPTIAEFTAVVDNAEAGELPERIGDVEQLLTPPDPAPIETSTEIEAIDGAYEWTFANGAKVVHLPSDIAVNLVDIQAASLGGWSATGEEYERILTGRLAPRAIAQSGVGDLTPAQLSRFLDNVSVAVTPFIGESSQGMTGQARSSDAEVWFQLMYLLMSEPRLVDQAFAEVTNIGEIILSLSQADPGWKALVAYTQARYGDDFGLFTPVATQEVLDDLTAESLLARYKERFASADDLVVVVVGDIDRETVEQLARTYVGTLPSDETDTFVNRRSPAPEGKQRIEIELGPDSRATSLQLYHEVVTDINPGVEAAVEVLQTLLNDRLVNDVREDIGATYSVRVGITTYFTPEQGIRSTLSASGDPEKMLEIEEEIFRILQDVVDGEVSEEDFDAAILVVSANYEFDNNARLIRSLYRRVFAGDDELPTARRMLSEISDLTIEDIVALAGEIFTSDQYIEIVRVLSEE